MSDRWAPVIHLATAVAVVATAGALSGCFAAAPAQTAVFPPSTGVLASITATSPVNTTALATCAATIAAKRAAEQAAKLAAKRAAALRAAAGRVATLTSGRTRTSYRSWRLRRPLDAEHRDLFAHAGQCNVHYRCGACGYRYTAWAKYPPSDPRFVYAPCPKCGADY